MSKWCAMRGLCLSYLYIRGRAVEIYCIVVFLSAHGMAILLENLKQHPTREYLSHHHNHLSNLVNSLVISFL